MLTTQETLLGDGREREELVRRIDRLCDEVLPERAKDEGGYPIVFDHCFRRVVFDVAAGGEWTDTVSRPFYQNAPTGLLRRAYAVSVSLYRGGRPAVRGANRISLNYRQ